MKSITAMLLICLMMPHSVNGYEIHTHTRMTQKGFEKVMEGDAQLLGNLGLGIIQDELGEVYYDVSGGAVYERFKSTNYEDSKKRMPDPDEVAPLSVKAWLLRGAIREDDLGEIAGIDFGPDPHDDPYDPFFRVFHHFFDPVNDAPLNGVSTIDTGGPLHTAPAWALGTSNANAFTAENTPESGRRNHYSIKDAREYMYRAATGQTPTGSKAIAPNGSGGAREPNDDAEGEQVRRAYWATTFRALGDIVHLIQDMGQPQPTRNDPHSPLNVASNAALTRSAAHHWGKLHA